MAFTLPSLPFSKTALIKKGMCEETLDLHHGKHHQAYVDKLNELVDKNTSLKDKNLKEVIEASYKIPGLVQISNNASQHWNHSFFWKSLSEDGGKIPKRFEDKIIKDFKSVKTFKDVFTDTAIRQFGSGWAWLVLGNDGTLKVTKTPNGVTAISDNVGKALLVLDVWEHAYYLDYRNRRPDYISNFLDNLANYEFAESRL